MQKRKWLSGEDLKIAVKRREVKSKGEKERYKHLNADFQRIARRDKKAFFRNQCKEIEENNRMGKTRDLFKKIRVTKGTALNMPANLENSAVATGLEKVRFHYNPKEGQCQKLFKIPHIIAFISHASKVMLKMLQARLQQYKN